MTPFEVRTALARAVHARVRVYYLTPAVHHDGRPYPTWGAVAPRGGEHHVSAHVIARVERVLQEHVIIQPDQVPRPVALRIASITSVANVLFRSGSRHA